MVSVNKTCPPYTAHHAPHTPCTYVDRHVYAHTKRRDDMESNLESVCVNKTGPPYATHHTQGTSQTIHMTCFPPLTDTPITTPCTPIFTSHPCHTVYHTAIPRPTRFRGHCAMPAPHIIHHSLPTPLTAYTTHSLHHSQPAPLTACTTHCLHRTSYTTHYTHRTLQCHVRHVAEGTTQTPPHISHITHTHITHTHISHTHISHTHISHTHISDITHTTYHTHHAPTHYAPITTPYASHPTPHTPCTDTPYTNYRSMHMTHLITNCIATSDTFRNALPNTDTTQHAHHSRHTVHTTLAMPHPTPFRKH